VSDFEKRWVFSRFRNVGLVNDSADVTSVKS